MDPRQPTLLSLVTALPRNQAAVAAGLSAPLAGRFWAAYSARLGPDQKGCEVEALQEWLRDGEYEKAAAYMEATLQTVFPST